MTKFEDFDPNAVPDRPWMTWKDGRVKLHAKRGYATSAFISGYQTILYELDGDTWVERARKSTGLPGRNAACDDCGRASDPSAYRGLVFCFRKENRRIADSLDLLVLCKNCAAANNA